MWDTCAVELRVRLPKPVAEEVEEVQRRDPEMLSRMLMYAVTRRTIFDQLTERDAAAARFEVTDEGVRPGRSRSGGIVLD